MLLSDLVGREHSRHEWQQRQILRAIPTRIQIEHVIQRAMTNKRQDPNTPTQQCWSIWIARFEKISREVLIRRRNVNSDTFQT